MSLSRGYAYAWINFGSSPVHPLLFGRFATLMSSRRTSTGDVIAHTIHMATRHAGELQLLRQIGVCRRDQESA